MGCKCTNLVLFHDLGQQPNGNTFLYANEVEKELFFDLSMQVCTDCFLVQLSYYPSADFMFSNHPYVSGLNKPVVRHFEILAKHIVNKIGTENGDLVIDVGCNDGSFLKCFAKHGLRVLGVDPGMRTGELAKKNGVLVFKQFWSHETGKYLSGLNVRPRIITATAVFYHVPDLHDFVLGLKMVMDETTVFVAQCVNMRDVIEKNEFDHFYHEHSCIYSISPLIKMLAIHGLRIHDVEMSDIHGGSFIAYIVRDKSPLKTTKSVATALHDDHEAGLYKIDTYHQFVSHVELNKRNLVALLQKLRAEKKTVYALGAPVKGSTLLNYFGIGPDLVELAVEVNEFKVGRVIPGVHIPVVDERSVGEPDYYLVLAWNFADFFREKFHEYLSCGGRFIVPCPTVEIIGPKE
mmetsp:Transcript_14068/g.34058  ORF Transcript_14068/g.34058 Transcript_14068/m.34058 type:complete len:405 (-) Transcript_14068:331-1545(-)